MVQILPAVPRKQSFAQKLNLGLGKALETGTEMMKLRELEKQYHQENEAAKQMGVDLSGIRDPDLRKITLTQGLQGLNQFQKLQNESDLEGRDYQTLKATFGDKFADIWKASPVGGRTELLKNAVDATLRGHDINEMFQGINPSQIEKPKSIDEMKEEKIPQMREGKISKDFNWPDYSSRPRGYTPKEWNDQRKGWRKENAEVFSENSRRLKNRQGDILGTKKLMQLNESGKLPQGLARILINPETGDFYGPAQLVGLKSPEAQEWSKVIARFQNRAKDAFGARVTNFDLQSYMQQFPGLLNTYEGRKRILEMMNINFELDNLYDKALQKVFQHYGLNGIPQEEADRLAAGMIGDETSRLENEFLNIESQALPEEESQLSERKVDVISPDGQLYEIDEREVSQLPEGWRIQ